MNSYEIVYKKTCFICTEQFFPKRCHAITCSTKCRNILHKLKIGLIEFSSQIGHELMPLNNNQLKEKIDYVKNAKMADSKGNLIEFVNGYTDKNGKIIRLIFRNINLRHLEIWNDYGDELNALFYKY